MQQAGVTSVYSFVSAMALWPVAAAAKNGEWAAVAALGSVVASVGGSVLASQLQNWKDETDGAQQLAAEVKTDEALQNELAVVHDQLDALNQARQALPEAARSWFDQALAKERAIVDSAVQYVANLKGSGAIAQGPGAVAAGRGGVAIGGNVYGSVIDSESTLSQEDEDAIRQGIEDIQRGAVKPWSQVKHDLELSSHANG